MRTHPFRKMHPFGTFLTAAALLFALCACTDHTTDSEQAVSYTESQTEPAVTEPVVTEPADPYKALYDNSAGAHLYTIDRLAETNSYHFLELYGDYILLQDTPYDSDVPITSAESPLYLYRISDGTKRLVTSASETIYASFSDTGKILVFAPTSMQLRVYDTNATLLYTADITEYADYLGYYLDTSDKAMLWLVQTKGTQSFLIGLPFDDDTEPVTVSLPAKNSFYLCGSTDTTVMLDAAGEDGTSGNYQYDKRSGKLTPISDAVNAFSQFGHDFAGTSTSERFWLRRMDEPANADTTNYIQVQKQDPNEEVWGANGNWLLTSVIDEQGLTMHCYDVSAASCTSLFLGAQTLSSCAISTDGTVALICRQQTEQVLLWDSRAESEQTAANISHSTLAQIKAENEVRAAQISKVYNIPVHHGADGVAFQCEFHGEPLLDPIQIQEALESVQKVLKRFPEKMLREMCVAPVEQIEMFLCRSLISDSEDQIDGAGAVTYSEGNKRIIVVDASDGEVEQNLSHELAHILDDRFWEAEIEDDLPYLSYWTTFVPKQLGDNSYYYSYTADYDSDTSYTVGGDAGGNEANVWFVIPYARTFPTEDRATIFETLFEETEPAAMTCPHLMEKAAYLCALIRKCYEIPDSQTLYWERYVDTTAFPTYLDDLSAYRD